MTRDSQVFRSGLVDCDEPGCQARYSYEIGYADSEDEEIKYLERRHWTYEMRRSAEHWRCPNHKPEEAPDV